MSDTSTNSASFNNFFGNSKRFGLNIKVNVDVPRRSLQEVKKAATKEAQQIVNPFSNFLASNEDVFNGNVEREIIKTQAQLFNTTMILNDAEERVNGKAPRFDANF